MSSVSGVQLTSFKNSQQKNLKSEQYFIYELKFASISQKHNTLYFHSCFKFVKQNPHVTYAELNYTKLTFFTINFKYKLIFQVVTQNVKSEITQGLLLHPFNHYAVGTYAESPICIQGQDIPQCWGFELHWSRARMILNHLNTTGHGWHCARWELPISLRVLWVKFRVGNTIFIKGQVTKSVNLKITFILLKLNWKPNNCLEFLAHGDNKEQTDFSVRFQSCL